MILDFLLTCRGLGFAPFFFLYSYCVSVNIETKVFPFFSRGLFFRAATAETCKVCKVWTEIMRKP